MGFKLGGGKKATPSQEARGFLKLKFLIIGLAVGAALGIGGVLFFQHYNPPDPLPEPLDVPAADEQVSIVFERIVAQNEMVSVSQKYSLVDKAVDSNRLFDLIDIPFSENSFWYNFVGEIKAGVNMGDASYRTEEKTIYVSLGEPYVIANTPDMDKTKVLVENNNLLLNPIHVEDVDAFQDQCYERCQQEAIADGLLEEARANAEANIRNMFNAALGDEYEIVFE